MARPLQSVSGFSGDSSDGAEDRVGGLTMSCLVGERGQSKGPGMEVTAVSYETHWHTGSLAVSVDLPGWVDAVRPALQDKGRHACAGPRQTAAIVVSTISPRVKGRTCWPANHTAVSAPRAPACASSFPHDDGPTSVIGDASSAVCRSGSP